MFEKANIIATDNTNSTWPIKSVFLFIEESLPFPCHLLIKTLFLTHLQWFVHHEENGLTKQRWSANRNSGLETRSLISFPFPVGPKK